jgi:hypothetical protein
VGNDRLDADDIPWLLGRACEALERIADAMEADEERFDRLQNDPKLRAAWLRMTHSEKPHAP